jgi:adenylate kinase
MAKQSIVFVGGIHGVGKSSFCSRLASALKAEHLNAGELISTWRQVTASVDKRVSEVAANQDALLGAIRAIPVRDSPILLDGHFCVLDSVGEITRISVQTFELLAPVVAVVIHDDVQRIQGRLRGRDNRSYPIEMLRTFQNAELTHAQHVCSAIGTELHVLGPDMLVEATQSIAPRLAAHTL